VRYRGCDVGLAHPDVVTEERAAELIKRGA
jgi:hypothetical protein